MSYVQNIKHLENILKNILREHSDCINQDELLPIEMYFELQKLELLDAYTWDVRQDPTLLHENNYFQWRRDRTMLRSAPRSYIDKTLTREFSDKAEELNGLSGVYAFYNTDDVCLYIGVSTNLGERVLTSFKERFRNYKKQIQFCYLLTKSHSDAHVLESVFIAKLKPVFNTSGKFEDELTFEVSTPAFSHKLLCNHEEGGKENV